MDEDTSINTWEAAVKKYARLTGEVLPYETETSHWIKGRIKKLYRGLSTDTIGTCLLPLLSLADGYSKLVTEGADAVSAYAKGIEP
jgi:hypothetical protein